MKISGKNDRKNTHNQLEHDDTVLSKVWYVCAFFSLNNLSYNLNMPLFSSVISLAVASLSRAFVLYGKATGMASLRSNQE